MIGLILLVGFVVWLALSPWLSSFFLRAQASTIVHSLLDGYDAEFEALHFSQNQKDKLKASIVLDGNVIAWLAQQSQTFQTETPAHQPEHLLTLKIQCERTYFFAKFKASLRSSKGVTPHELLFVWTPFGWLKMGNIGQTEGKVAVFLVSDWVEQHGYPFELLH